MTFNSSTIKPDIQAEMPATANAMQLAESGGSLLLGGLLGSAMIVVSTAGLHAAFSNIPIVGVDLATFFGGMLVIYAVVRSLIAAAIMTAAGVIGEVMAAGQQVTGISEQDYEKFLSLKRPTF